MMKRDLCFQALARRLPHDIVVSTFSSAFEWVRARPHPLNYLSVGAMGLASSHALGLALAVPHRRIIVLDGDGSLLMNLGTLVTIAEAAPRNLIHFVSENGTYEANGAHRTPGSGKTKLSAIASAAGYARAACLQTLEEFETQIDGLLEATGPVYIGLAVEPGEPIDFDYPMMHSAKVRSDFKAALAASEIANGGEIG